MGNPSRWTMSGTGSPPLDRLYEPSWLLYLSLYLFMSAQGFHVDLPQCRHRSISRTESIYHNRHTTYTIPHKNNAKHHSTHSIHTTPYTLEVVLICCSGLYPWSRTFSAVAGVSHLMKTATFPSHIHSLTFIIAAQAQIDIHS